MPTSRDWLIAGALLVVGMGTFILGLVFGRQLRAEWVLLMVAAGAGLGMLGGRLLLEYFAERYGAIEVPPWVWLPILILPVAVLLVVVLVNRE